MPRLLRRTRGRDDAGPGLLGELHGEVPDGTGAGLHQDRLAFDRPVREDSVVRGAGRNTEAGANSEIGALRQRMRAVGSDNRIFGGRAEGARLAAMQPDTLPDPAVIDT